MSQETKAALTPVDTTKKKERKVYYTAVISITAEQLGPEKGPEWRAAGGANRRGWCW